MTDRNALTDLIEAVESGHDDEVDGHACALFHGSGQCRDVVSAYHGSLDAAKALHEALLPGWEWGIYADKSCWVGDSSVDFSEKSDNPARAWLIAVLRALAEKEAPRD